jgi:hypothetical protein
MFACEMTLAMPAAWKARSIITLVPIRPRRRGERRSLRTLPGVSLRPGSLAFNPRPRPLSTPFLTPFNSTPMFARIGPRARRARRRRDRQRRRGGRDRRRRGDD